MFLVLYNWGNGITTGFDVSRWTCEEVLPASSPMEMASSSSPVYYRAIGIKYKYIFLPPLSLYFFLSLLLCLSYSFYRQPSSKSLFLSFFPPFFFLLFYSNFLQLASSSSLPLFFFPPFSSLELRPPSSRLLSFCPPFLSPLSSLHLNYSLFFLSSFSFLNLQTWFSKKIKKIKLLPSHSPCIFMLTLL